MTKHKALPITVLPPGEKIQTQGVYEMPLSRYHSDCSWLPGASSGDLVKIAGSGEEYWDSSYYNPKNQTEKARIASHESHFRFGSAAHAKILEPKTWINDYIVRPKHFKSWRGGDAQHWRWVQEYQKGLTTVTPDEVDRVDAMAERILADPITSILFSNGVPEVSMFLEMANGTVMKTRGDMIAMSQDPETGRWAMNDSVFVDYKTTYDNSVQNCLREINKRGYDMKLANCAFVACRLFNLNFADIDFILSFQKSDAPFGITNIELDNERMFKLVAKNLYANDLFAQGILAKGKLLDLEGDIDTTGQGWRGYSEDIVKFKGWDNDRLDGFIGDGTYPNIDPKTMKIVKD